MRIVVDCGFQLHKDIGPGLLESAYEALLASLIADRGLSVARQVAVPVTYRGQTVKDAFRVDLMIEQRLIVEIKSLEKLAPIHTKQLLTYLRVTRQPIGLLINFGAELFRDGIRRNINNHSPYKGSTRSAPT